MSVFSMGRFLRSGLNSMDPFNQGAGVFDVGVHTVWESSHPSQNWRNPWLSAGIGVRWGAVNVSFPTLSDF